MRTIQERFKDNLFFTLEVLRSLPCSVIFQEFFGTHDNDALWAAAKDGFPAEVVEVLGAVGVPKWNTLWDLKQVQSHNGNWGVYLNLLIRGRTHGKYAYCGSAAGWGGGKAKGGLAARTRQHQQPSKWKNGVHDQVRKSPGTKGRFLVMFEIKPSRRHDADTTMFRRGLCKVMESALSLWLGCYDYVSSAAVGASWKYLSPCSDLFEGWGEFEWLGACSHSAIDEGIRMTSEMRLQQVQAVYKAWLQLDYDELPAAAQAVWTPNGIADEEERAIVVAKVMTNEASLRIYRDAYRLNKSEEDDQHLLRATQRYQARRLPEEVVLVRRRDKLRREWNKQRMTDDEYKEELKKCDEKLAIVRATKKKASRAAWGTFRRTAYGARKARCLA